MSIDSYAISSASESQDAEMGETMVPEGPIKYKGWVWEHFTCAGAASTDVQAILVWEHFTSRKTSQDLFFTPQSLLVEIALFLNVIVE